MATGIYKATTYMEALEIAFNDDRTWEPRHRAAIGNAIVSQTPVLRSCAVYFERDDITGQSILVRQVAAKEYQVIVQRADVFVNPPRTPTRIVNQI